MQAFLFMMMSGIFLTGRPSEYGVASLAHDFCLLASVIFCQVDDGMLQP